MIVELTIYRVVLVLLIPILFHGDQYEIFVKTSVLKLMNSNFVL